VLMGAGVLIDPRVLHGAPVWLKPAKFALSLSVYLLTLAWFMGYVRPAFRTSIWAGGAAATAVATALFELVYIAWRAGRGEASHFNFDSPLAITMYTLMGVGAVLLTAASVPIAVGVARADRPIGAAFRLSVVLGLLLAFGLGTAVGGILAASDGHWIGGDLTDATGLPLLGWSTTGGDLRIAHFFGLHALQIIPIVGLLVNRLSRPVGIGVVIGFSAAYSALVYWLAAEALAGRPPWTIFGL
jgi:hypothetical protein